MRISDLAQELKISEAVILAKLKTLKLKRAMFASFHLQITHLMQ